jgi:hypothetical protein
MLNIECRREEMKNEELKMRNEKGKAKQSVKAVSRTEL